MLFTTQFAWLVILAIPVACVSWTVTHEEIFREPREYFQDRSKNSPSYLVRKICYLFTCEYCFSHYVAIGFLALTGFKLLVDDWRGYIVSGFALVWVANIYMSIYARLRLNIKKERVELEERESNNDSGE